MWEIASVLCPTDFSDSSDWTFRVACGLAREHGARLIVLHVAPKKVVTHVENVSRLSPEMARERLWQAMREPRAEEADLRVEHRLEEGDPIQGILRVANETNCDLIVIGRHPQLGWKRWLLGGVAEAVIQNSPCSVLVVKEVDPADEPDFPVAG